MLYGLMSGIIPIDGANETWPLSNDAAWRLVLTPSGATGSVNALQLAIDNSDLINGAVTITLDGGKYLLSGKAAGNQQSVGDYRDALLQIVDDFIPYSTYTFDADVSAPQVETTSTGSGSGTTTNDATGAANSTGGLPSKIFGIDTKLILVIGAAALIFMNSSGKGK